MRQPCLASARTVCEPMKPEPPNTVTRPRMPILLRGKRPPCDRRAPRAAQRGQAPNAGRLRIEYRARRRINDPRVSYRTKMADDAPRWRRRKTARPGEI